MSDIVPPIPGVSLDQDGKILVSRAWYRFFIALWDRTGGSAGPSGGGGGTSTVDTLFGDEFQREMLGTTNQVIVTDGTQMSGRTTFATPQDIDTAADVIFNSATLNDAVTSLTTIGSIVVGLNATVTGDVAINGGDLTTSAVTFNLLNATATTINFGAGASVGINAGNASGANAILGNTTFSQTVTINGTGTGLTVANDSALGNAASDNTTITGYLNPYVAFGSGTDWTANTLGGVQFTSASSDANAKARAYIRLLQKPYTAAPSAANDITALVGLWLGGNYAGATTTALPLYLGGMYTSSAQWPAVVINTVGQLLAADSVIGFSATPAYSFQSDTDLGWYRASSNQLRITGGGNDMIAFDGNSPSGGYQSQITVYSQLVSGPVGAPSASAPQIALTYSNTGFYTVGANDIGFSTNGTKAGQAVSGRWLLGPTITDDTSTRLQVEGGIRATNWEKIAGLSLYAAVHG